MEMLQAKRLRAGASLAVTAEKSRPAEGRQSPPGGALTIGMNRLLGRPLGKKGVHAQHERHAARRRRARAPHHLHGGDADAHEAVLAQPPEEGPEREHPPPPPDADGPVVLTVEPGGVLRINKQVVERAELKEKLLRIFAKRKDQILFFDAKDDVPYGVAAEVMDIARTGGARTISILTEKTE